MNTIDKVRKETQQSFNDSAKMIGSEEVLFSPNGNYKVETALFKSNRETCYEITKVDVFETPNLKLLFSFLVNEGTFFYSWVRKDGIDYLLCAEDLCGGQTVIDLTNIKMSSYTTDQDGFIWTKHLLSPDQNWLAVFGCGWGSSFFTIIYKFSNPMELPLPIEIEPEWVGYDIMEWVDNKHLRVKNSEKEEFILAL